MREGFVMKPGVPHRTVNVLMALVAITLIAPPLAAEISPARLEATVRFLADDAQEGRGAGSEGLGRARKHIVDHFHAIGLEPGFDASYTQAYRDPSGMLNDNVVGIVMGDPGEEHVIVAAHYDHLGFGDDPESPVIHNGADDNASGVAALLEIAAWFAEAEEAPSRTLVFAAFSGEEIGLLGAKHYIANPALPLSGARAMINLDSVGRLRDDRLIVFGTGTADIFDKMLDGVNLVSHFSLGKNTEGIGAGDHAAFFEKGIPVLHLFTDAHLDYHRPTDDVERVNFDGLIRVTEFATEIVSYLSDVSVPLTFIPAGAEKVKAPAPSGRRRVSLGTIPDFTRESGGILLTGTIPGSPAETAGLRKGDLVVAIDDESIDTLQDYSAVLKSHEPGDEITVVFERDGKRMTATVELVARR